MDGEETDSNKKPRKQKWPKFTSPIVETFVSLGLKSVQTVSAVQLSGNIETSGLMENRHNGLPWEIIRQQSASRVDLKRHMNGQNAAFEREQRQAGV